MLSTEPPLHSSLGSLPARTSRLDLRHSYDDPSNQFIAVAIHTAWPVDAHAAIRQLPDGADDKAATIIVSRLLAFAGLTNDCLVASSNELAMRYNDRSVLENHHCCTFSRLALCPPCLTMPIRVWQYFPYWASCLHVRAL